jgi:MFS family permease
MAGILRPVTALLLGAALLLMGNGLLSVLGPIRADAEGFTRLDIGIMGSLHFAGLMTGCLVWPRVIATVGHIRAFAAFTAIATITPLAQAVWSEPAVWWALRALNGLAFAGLFMVIESWLNGASSDATRGRVLASYTMINLTVVTLGMQFVAAGEPTSFELFTLVAILYSLAAVPVALAPTGAPTPPRTVQLRLGWLFSVSPAAVIGCFCTGLANSSFWTLGPLYATGAGMRVQDAALFLTAAVLGGAAGQWPVGRLSDHIGRRPMAMIVCTVAALAGVALWAGSAGGKSLILILGVVYGTAAFTVYTLCVAHANDLVHKKRAVEVSSGLLLVFSLGAILGPLMGSLVMSLLGSGALFLHSAAAHTAIAAVMILRARQRPSLPLERNAPFLPVPKTTPDVFDLDPRGEREADGSSQDIAADEPLQAAPRASLLPRQSNA